MKVLQGECILLACFPPACLHVHLQYTIVSKLTYFFFLHRKSSSCTSFSSAACLGGNTSTHITLSFPWISGTREEALPATLPVKETKEGKEWHPLDLDISDLIPRSDPALESCSFIKVKHNWFILHVHLQNGVQRFLGDADHFPSARLGSSTGCITSAKVLTAHTRGA